MFCLHKMPLFVRHSPLKQKRLKCKLNMKFSCCFCVSLALKVLSSICLNCFKPENKACQGIQFLAMSLLFTHAQTSTIIFTTRTVMSVDKIRCEVIIQQLCQSHIEVSVLTLYMEFIAISRNFQVPRREIRPVIPLMEKNRQKLRRKAWIQAA